MVFSKRSRKTLVAYSLLALVVSLVLPLTIIMNKDWLLSYRNNPQFLPSPGGIEFGMNLGGISDWGREWPFLNLMKCCRPWMTANVEWMEDGKNDWDTEYMAFIACDEEGYPLELPYGNETAEAPQGVHTIFADISNFPLGRYILTYDGNGTFAFWGNWDVISEQPGRIELNLTDNSGPIAFHINFSERDNHVRNITLLYAVYESLYAQTPFNPVWTEKLSDFVTIRFMDWAETNFHVPLVDWVNRSHVSDYCYALGRGVPYEYMIDVCNRLTRDAWVCIPHEASDDYLTQMADLFNDTLNPDLTLYVEYSNEIWNWMFPSSHYLEENGNQDVDWPERIVPFIQNVLDIFSTEFAGQLDRLVRVVGVQAGWYDVGNRMISNMRPGSFDAVSPTAYFGFTDAAYASLEASGSSTTVEDVFNLAKNSIDGEGLEWISLYLNRTMELGLKFLFYESGQHLTPDPFGSVQPYNQALVDIQYHDAMYYLYNYWFNRLREIRQNSSYIDNFLFMTFSFASSSSGRYGTWGVLPDIYMEPPFLPEAPKYQAILDNLNHP
jgi:hypothetical protein